MLPDRLNAIKVRLESKSRVLRTSDEKGLLDELLEVDKALEAAKTRDRRIVETVEKYSSVRGTAYMGPAPGSVCPICGK